MLLEGQQVGHFRLLHLLGSGGMGAVYLAADMFIQRQVAIKVIRTDTSLYSDDNAAKEAAHLFRREANAVALLDHPNILPLFDFGEESLNGATLTYMVMPFRQEGSLADWLRRPGNSRPLSPQDVAFIIHQAASALQFAHDHNIIHRDVKPSNFLIRGRPENPVRPDLLLADFGIAKFSTAVSSADTMPRGTPIYMPPEQWEDRPVLATDQYALAIMTYELLSGRPPFQGNHGQLMYQHFHIQPSPPSSTDPFLSFDIDAIVLRALAKKPNNRFPSIASFDQAFQQAVRNINNIHITLPINQMEAINGTSRTVTLPDGRLVTVGVPARAYDGLVIRLEGQGKASNYDEPAGALIITITISRIEETVVSLLNSGTIEETLPELDTHNNEMLVNHRQGLTRGKIMLLALALIVIAGSLGLFFVSMSRQNAVAQANASATALANSTAIASTATSNVQMTGTAQTNATATAQAQVNASATAQAQTNATATAQAQANATATAQAIATAQANATATANAAATATFIAQNPDPYYPKGNIALYDELRNNTNGYNWDEDTTADGACAFSGGAYHVKELQAKYFYGCFAQKTNFSNFAFQVRMTIISGDCGGIFLRANSGADKYYFFEVCQDGSYKLTLYIDNNSADAKALINTNTNSAINTGLNQPNQIAVVANGSTIDLYVNNQKIDSKSDNTYSSGQIGVFADDYNNTTEVAFSNAEVWTF